MSFSETEIRDQMDAWISSMNNLIYEAEKLRGYKSKGPFINFIQVIYDKALAIKEIRKKLIKNEEEINNKRIQKKRGIAKQFPLNTEDHKKQRYSRQIDIEYEYSRDMLLMIQCELDNENLLIRRNVGIEYGSITE